MYYTAEQIEALDNFVIFLDAYISHEIELGAALSECTSRPALAEAMNLFINGEDV